jgi:L-glutamine-phosphate cytidylyltransferase
MAGAVSLLAAECKAATIFQPHFSSRAARMIKRAIILSAGQGSRLLPLTESLPKCLIEFSGKTLLAWQVDLLVAGGIERIDVVTGFMTEKVEAELTRLARPGLTLTACFNPFYKVADNLGSCWIARAAMDEDFLILNGDTLISREIVARVLEDSDWPVRVTVDIKPAYDSDDMKVERSQPHKATLNRLAFWRFVGQVRRCSAMPSKASCGRLRGLRTGISR